MTYDVAVGVHRKADLRVPEQLHQDARVYLLLQQEARATVPQIMKPDASYSGFRDDTLKVLV